ncbi:hypothetical protein [Gloeocapsa sp. PCC 73106]|uniref:hypothetical protein n=1 Tax=Gloeocapsa sp. PCC 73106 TaxID=102232 RepID=UPI0002AC4119|nr:hypothetical protein [Gloeocapsa sp. PCC 73106]ELR98395.1 hypothetical protein GLO73106DRAFT_00022260 [Gloeocapsa sp. PCC 73106]
MARAIGKFQRLNPLLHRRVSLPLWVSLLGLVLALSLILGSAVPTLAQTSASTTQTPATPSDKLTEEIKLLAKSEVEDNILRRTDFVIKLYSNNSAGLTSPKIRAIYDEEYSKQVETKDFWRLMLIGIIGIVAILVLVAVFLINRRSLGRFVKRLTSVSVSLPFGIGQVNWQPDLTERRAAWSLYVELVTRIATQSLESDQGLLREALNSLYDLFKATRQILKDAGPDVGASRESVGGIAIAVLNQGLRPFLSTWHPRLQEWEAQRPDNISPKEHETNWSEKSQLRSELELLRENLEQYAKALAEIVGVQT